MNKLGSFLIVFLIIAISLGNKATAQQNEEVSFAISATKMNVFYVGIENPVSIAVSNVSPEDLIVNISSGSIINRTGVGTYIVKVRKTEPVTINLSTIVNGETVKLGSQEYRCKRVPDPYPNVGGKRGGVISLQNLLATNHVSAGLGDFVFDLKFPVVSFSLSISSGGFIENKSSNSSIITAGMKNMLRECESGQKIFFEDIKARSPDGSIRQLGAIAFTIK